MAEDAEHQLVGVDVPKKPEEPSQFGRAVGILFVLFLVIASIAGGGGGSKGPPTPPEPRAALITSADGAPFVVGIGGANYTFNYMTQEVWRARGGSLDRPICIADFLAHTITGDLIGAKTIVVRGKMELHVGSIRGVSSLVADITTRDKEISAYFNYAQSPTGPPAMMADHEQNRGRRVNIVVLGELRHVNIGDAYGSSHLDVSLLDLEPSAASVGRYKDEKREWEFKQVVERNRPKYERR